MTFVSLTCHISFTAVTLWGQRASLAMTHYNNAYTASNRPAQFTNAAHKFHLGRARAGDVQSHSSVGTGVILLSIGHQETNGKVPLHHAALSYTNALSLIWSSLGISFNWGRYPNKTVKQSSQCQIPRFLSCFLWGVYYSNLRVSFMKGKYWMACTSVSRATNIYQRYKYLICDSLLGMLCWIILRWLKAPFFKDSEKKKPFL